ncbi:MAG: cytochrome ubiquinol oxidase subunit I [Candidatus Obscuribacterales bacterium]|jgi:cytochrome bd ubiquinol oxidase subunit I|nr:cytochrome ubiquinol oxidase subunit I [Candidatus Obscuribacterales bacterium]
MHLDPLFLSRLQFALTIMFHYIFPPLTIGLSVFMVMIEAVWMKTGNPIYESMAKFWTKIFAVNFAMGVATGIVMEFEFGTNWAVYSKFVGDVFGSALAAEGIFAFFLESGFLSVLVFGWGKVSRGMHFFSTVMVCLGSIFSSIWITVANSWQQTPAGYHLVKTASGLTRAEITDFWAMVFNPSTVPRLLHVWVGAFVLGAFFVLSVSAFYILKNRHLQFAERTFKIALVYAAITSLLAAASGHLQACEVADYQPAKLAAMEAHFETGTEGTGLYIFGWPDPEAKTVRYGLKIPYLLSLLVYFDPHKPVAGLDKFARDVWPPVTIPFLSFHLMVMLGGYFLSITLLGLYLWWQKKLFTTRWLLWFFVFSAIPAIAANELGWVTAEVGRQPWIVYGLLRTADGFSKTVPAEHILGSIIMFSIIYALLFVVWLYVLHNKILHGPEDALESSNAVITGKQKPSKSKLKKQSSEKQKSGKLKSKKQEKQTKSLLDEQKSLMDSAARRSDPAGPSMTLYKAEDEE